MPMSFRVGFFTANPHSKLHLNKHERSFFMLVMLRLAEFFSVAEIKRPLSALVLRSGNVANPV